MYLKGSQPYLGYLPENKLIKVY